MARQQFDLIVFDWDGTLMDSTAHIARSIQAACRDLGLPVPATEAASYVIGLGLRLAHQRLHHECAMAVCGEHPARTRGRVMHAPRQTRGICAPIFEHAP